MKHKSCTSNFVRLLPPTFTRSVRIFLIMRCFLSCLDVFAEHVILLSFQVVSSQHHWDRGRTPAPDTGRPWQLSSETQQEQPRRFHSVCQVGIFTVLSCSLLHICPTALLLLNYAFFPQDSYVVCEVEHELQTSPVKCLSVCYWFLRSVLVSLPGCFHAW